MVSIVTVQSDQQRLSQGLNERDGARVIDAAGFVAPIYGEQVLASGQGAQQFAHEVALTLAQLATDAETRIAGLLVDLHACDANAFDAIEERFGKDERFRELAARFIAKFEALLAESGRADPDDVLNTAFLTADIGKLYLLLQRNIGKPTAH